MKRTIDVANVLLQNSASEILLLQRAPKLKRGYIWGLPGGMVDSGEEPLQTATRELAEETGVKESELSISGMARFLVEMPDENVMVANVRAGLINNEVLIDLDPNEHIAYKWASENDIFASSNLLPCVPTMIARTLNLGTNFVDLTITPGTRVTQLHAAS